MLLLEENLTDPVFPDPGFPLGAPWLKLNYHNVRTRFTLRDDVAGGTPLELPRRSTILPGLFVAAMFAVFAGILISQIAKLNLHVQAAFLT